MKKISWVFLCLVLGYFFTTILVGCGGGGSGGGAVSAISGANPLQDIVTNDSKTSTITINSKGKANSVFNAVAGLMTLEVSEENTLNPEAVIKISETLSNGSENPLLTSGSVIYTINPVKNDLPIKLTTKPLKLIFTNEDKLSKAQSYYVGIKEIDGGKWQFASLYAANSSSRASIGPKGPFEFNLYKENVYVALFADLNNSAKDLSRVLGINASMSASVVHSYNDKYTEDIRVNIKLSGDNLGKLKADDINVKIGFGCQDKNTSSRIGIDSGTAKYPICDSVNKYELAGENFARYYKFSPLSTNFKSQSVPEFSFDLNLKGTPLSGFSNDFVVEISNANDNSLPFCYFYPVHFDIEEKEPDSEGGSKPDEETNPDDETKPDDGTKPDEETKPSDDTKPADEEPEEEPQPIIPANVSLKSSADDFKVSGDKIMLEFDKDISWSESDRDKISIDNGVFVSSCEYSNKVLNLSLNSRLKYNTDYEVSIKGLKYVKDSNFTFKTESKARVSLKSPSTGLSIDSGVVELEFSKDILWNQNYSKNITIDNNVEISGYSYSNKVLKIYLKNNLLYNSHYIIKIAGIDAVEDNDSLEFTTEESVVSPVISVDESCIDSELPSNYSLSPILIIDFGKKIINKETALSKIKFNDNELPQNCKRVFNENNQEAVITFTEDLEILSTYKLCVNSFSDDDGALIASSSDLVFNTIPPVEIRGSGTEEDPFQIYRESHLRKLNETEPVNYKESGYYFKQMKDITLTKPWVPIGIRYEESMDVYQEEPFVGFYDGGGYSITGLRYSNNSEDVRINGIGLFGFIKNSKIKNLNLSNVEISETFGDQIGIIAGRVVKSEIENINVFGKIELNGINCVGGLIGFMDHSTVNHCSVYSLEGFIQGEYYVGGLLGSFGNESEVTNSFSNIHIIANCYVGGLCGETGESRISDCYSNSSIEVELGGYGEAEIGGLIGCLWSGEVNNCYSSGNILLKSSYVIEIGVITGYRDMWYVDTIIENTFSSSRISVENLDDYEFDGSANCYNPDNEDVPLWWNYYGYNNNQNSYEYNESGSNYVGNGYKSQLNWDSNIWLNLTEGQLPKLAGFQNQ